MGEILCCDQIQQLLTISVVESFLKTYYDYKCILHQKTFISRFRILVNFTLTCLHLMNKRIFELFRIIYEMMLWCYLFLKLGENKKY